MKWNKYFLPLAAFVSMTTGFAETCTDDEATSSMTYKEEDGLLIEQSASQQKSEIEFKPQMNNLAISGDVRAKWTRKKHKLNGVDVLGSNGYPSDYYESRVNLLFNFDTDDSWSQVKLEFKNPMGVVSGKSNGIAMRRAFIGYDFLQNDNQELYMEVGRQGSSDIFESQVQFDSTYDGIVLGYDYTLPTWGHIYIHGGPLVVNNVTDQFAWIGEVGFTNIGATGLYTKYSYAHWRKCGVDATGTKNSPEFRYANSQVTLGYVFKNKILGLPARLFSGFVHNHVAKATESSAHKRRPNAYYAGFNVGKLEKGGDWNFTVAYERVELNSIPQFDLSGIGRGFSSGASPAVDVDPMNPANYPKVDGEYPNPDDQPASTFEGNTNYQGYSLTATYNITAFVGLRGDFKQSWQLAKAVGGENFYTEAALSLICSF